MAAASLKKLVRRLSGGKLVNALSAVRTPAQLHAAIKQLTARVSVVKRQEGLHHLEDRNKLCLQLAPSVLAAVDHTVFLSDMHPILRFTCSLTKPSYSIPPP